MEIVNLREKFSRIHDYWNPRIAGELNEGYVKLVKLKGEFVWHHHEAEGELFLVVEGRFRMQLRDGHRDLGPRELIIVPRGGSCPGCGGKRKGRILPVNGSTSRRPPGEAATGGTRHGRAYQERRVSA